MVPIRFVFRSRWAALAWSAGIVWTAVSFAGGHSGDMVNAANSADNHVAQQDALRAEDSF